MKQGTANLAEDYCFIHKALRPVSKARRKIAAVPPSNSRPVITHKLARANQFFGCSDLGDGEGDIVNPNIVRIVMHIGIYGRSLRRFVNIQIPIIETCVELY